jgi:hypothetical protein
MPVRRFPPPWSVEETDACFIVRAASGQALAYVYFEEEPGRRSAAHLLAPTRPGASPPTSPSCRSCCQEACYIVRDANGQALAVENSPSHSLFNGRDCPDAYPWWT